MSARPVIIVGTLVFTDAEQPPQPPGIWGGANQPFPTPPIVTYPGGTPNPPGTWGGGGVPMPNPPIANVPGAPGYRPPGDHIWGGANEPFPTPPIALPGLPGWSPPGSNVPSHPIEEPPKLPPPDGYEWKQTYSPPTKGGWTWTLVPE